MGYVRSCHSQLYSMGVNLNGKTFHFQDSQPISQSPSQSLQFLSNWHTPLLSSPPSVVSPRNGRTWHGWPQQVKCLTSFSVIFIPLILRLQSEMLSWPTVNLELVNTSSGSHEGILPVSHWLKVVLVYACCPVVSINSIPFSYQRVLGCTLNDIDTLALPIMPGTTLVPRSPDYLDSDGDFKVVFGPCIDI